MNNDANADDKQHTKSDREILELRVDLKLAEAKELLRKDNEEQIEKLVTEKHEPRFKQLRNRSALIIAALVAIQLFEWFGIKEKVKERVKEEANKVIDEKLVDPQLSNTLNEALSQKAVPFIAKELHPLSNQVVSLQLSVAAAQSEEKNLREEQRLMGLLNRAVLFDKSALVELRQISERTNDFAELARTMVDKVERSLVAERGNSAMITTTESLGTNDYSGPFASDELASKLWTYSGSRLEGVINELPENKLFVPKLVEIAHQTKDLVIVARISRKLSNIIGVSFFPWDLKPLDSWWADNHSVFTNWPYEELTNGWDALLRCDYARALTNFQSVLSVDGSADKSRALSVASAIKLNALQKAQSLDANYQNDDSRWALWGHAQMILSTNVVAGTKAFISLSKKYPTMVVSGFITPRDDLAKGIDWNLYSELMYPTNQIIGTNVNSVL